LSGEICQLWRTLILNIYMTQDEAQKILNTSSILFDEKVNHYYLSSGEISFNKKELNWFSLAIHPSGKINKYGYRDNIKYLTIKPFVRNLFMPYFLPGAYDNDKGLNELPTGKWRTVNVENNSINCFKLFQVMMTQNAFPIKKKGIGVSDMKRALKKLPLEEFFPDDTNEYRENLRAFSYIQLLTLCCYFFVKNSNTSYEDTLRILINKIDMLESYMQGILFPHIKGLRKQMVDAGRESKLYTMMLNWLREEPERWVSINDIFMQICVIENNINTTRLTTLVFHPNDEQSSILISNGYNGHSITADKYAKEFGYTGLRMCAFQLASLGIVEIAIDEESKYDISPFDAIEYLKLTPLGRYALGISNDYEAPEQEHVAYFELDPDRLIIRSLVNPNPYAQLLLDTSVLISHNRYETSALSFLANCHKREDVESKISTFRKFISKDLPPLWEQFFQQLLQHCHPLTEDHVSYRHYTLSPDNHELIQLITNDPKIQSLVIRAEGYRILLKSENQKKFETQLKKHGYLL